MSYYEAGLLFAIAGIVFVRLQEPDEIFDFIPELIPEGSVFRKLFGCPKCVSGQLSFWVLTVNGAFNHRAWDYVEYSAITIVLSIFFSMILPLLIKKIE